MWWWHSFLVVVLACPIFNTFASVDVATFEIKSDDSDRGRMAGPGPSLIYGCSAGKETGPCVDSSLLCTSQGGKLMGYCFIQGQYKGVCCTGLNPASSILTTKAPSHGVNDDNATTTTTTTTTTRRPLFPGFPTFTTHSPNTTTTDRFENFTLTTEHLNFTMLTPPSNFSESFNFSMTTEHMNFTMITPPSNFSESFNFSMTTEHWNFTQTFPNFTMTTFEMNDTLSNFTLSTPIMPNMTFPSHNSTNATATTPTTSESTTEISTETETESTTTEVTVGTTEGTTSNSTTVITIAPTDATTTEEETETTATTEPTTTVITVAPTEDTTTEEVTETTTTTEPTTTVITVAPTEDTTTEEVTTTTTEATTTEEVTTTTTEATTTEEVTTPTTEATTTEEVTVASTEATTTEEVTTPTTEATTTEATTTEEVTTPTTEATTTEEVTTSTTEPTTTEEVTTPTTEATTTEEVTTPTTEATTTEEVTTPTTEETSTAAPSLDRPEGINNGAGCGVVSSEIRSRFQNPSYPSLDMEANVHEYTVVMQDDYCALRIDFVQTLLAGKRTEGCATDSVVILNSKESPTTPLCGPLEGYQLTVTQDPQEWVKIVVTVQSAAYLWNINLTQVRCSSIKPYDEYQASNCGIKNVKPVSPQAREEPLITSPLKLLQKKRGTKKIMGFQYLAPTNILRNELLSRGQNLRIVRGNETAVNEWPWQALLIFNGKPLCGATVINEEWILTAGHCINLNLKYPLISMLMVDLGDHDIRTTKETKNTLSRVSKIVPNVQNDGAKNDIALIKLASKLKFGKTVRPVCLPSSKNLAENITGQNGITTGWGRTEDSAGSHVLREAILPIISTDKCRQEWAYVDEDAAAAIDNQMVCAGGGDVGPCNGDDGGPLVVQDANNKWNLVGVSTYGILSGCGVSGIPTVFTKLTAYSKWIELNIAKV